MFDAKTPVAFSIASRRKLKCIKGAINRPLTDRVEHHLKPGFVGLGNCLFEIIGIDLVELRVSLQTTGPNHRVSGRGLDPRGHQLLPFLDADAVIDPRLEPA